MKYIKMFETSAVSLLHLNENEKYRKINVRELFEIYNSNKSEFLEYEKYKNKAFNFNYILSEILINQKISFFGKTFNNRIFRDILGIVDHVSLWSFPFSMDLLLTECSENFYKNTQFDVDINVPIKIYSEEISEVEERFYLIKNMKKYNL